MCILWNFIITRRAYPTYWAYSTVTLLFKNSGCFGIYGNYRGICGSSIPGKLYEKAWAAEATKYLCHHKFPILNIHQCGFMPGRWWNVSNFCSRTRNVDVSALPSVSIASHLAQACVNPAVSTWLRNYFQQTNAEQNADASTFSNQKFKKMFGKTKLQWSPALEAPSHIIRQRAEDMSPILFRCQPYCGSRLWLEGGPPPDSAWHSDAI